MAALPEYSKVELAQQLVQPANVVQYMFSLMLRNIATDGYVFTDPHHPNTAEFFSRPGCIIASPSFDNTFFHVDQDYVFNWTRDSAVVAMELAAADLSSDQLLGNYLDFARICQTSGGPIHHAAYTIAGRPREGWTDQSDGPALRILAVLQAYPKLDAQGQTEARTVIGTDVDFLLGAYQNETFNLWEEFYGFSFFARSVQLRCFRELAANTAGIPVKDGVAEAITSLKKALDGHWDEGLGIYLTFGPGSSYQPPGQNKHVPPAGYNPNIDIVLAAVYGAVSITDPKMLATAGKILRQWQDPSQATAYPINKADADRNLGPLLGRYPDDTYDGDISDGDNPVGHPWALCTANFAELYYRLAAEITASGSVPVNNLTQDFFGQVGITSATPATGADTLLRSAGDRMLAALVFHSDHLELSEQFDKDNGFEKSVKNLTWSYAAFLSAVRAATGAVVHD
jgi:glucoamylase